jgi:hypothetical protein
MNVAKIVAAMVLTGKVPSFFVFYGGSTILNIAHLIPQSCMILLAVQEGKY